MQAPIPARITIDFTPDANPANGWIVGRVTGGSGRLELVRPIVAEPREELPTPPGYDAGDCTCPDFWCPVDHANE
jgi:hypothetical protein